MAALLILLDGHAFGFSAMASRLAAAVRPAQAADLSGLVLTASLVGGVLGVAGPAGVYVGAAPSGSAQALSVTTEVLAAALVVTTVFALCAPAAAWTAGAPTRARTI